MLPDNRAALGLLHKLSPDATVRFAGGEYEASMPLAARELQRELSESVVAGRCAPARS